MNRIKLAGVAAALLVAAAVGTGIGWGVAQYLIAELAEEVKSSRLQAMRVQPSSYVSTSDIAVAAGPQPADLEALAGWVAKVDAEVSKPGWVHLTYTSSTDSDQDNNGILPNGQPIPLRSLADEWYQLNDDGLVIASVGLMLTEDRQVVQVGTYYDGIGYNSTTSDTYELRPFKLHLDFHFLDDTQAMLKQGVPVTQQMVTLNNQEVVVYAFREDYPPDRQNSPLYEQPVLAGEVMAYFDPVTGNLLEMNTIFVLADGTRRLLTSVQSIRYEGADTPPPEILNYLNATR